MWREVKKAVLAAAFGVVASLSAAEASVIPGPALVAPDSTWSVTGLSFTAVQDATLDSFIFRSQGRPDTIVLTDAAGNILHAIASSGGPVSVSWDLFAGQQYWLLQTAADNAMFVAFGSALPSNAEIAIVMSGVYNLSISGAVNNTFGTGLNTAWFAFNDITTSPRVAPPAVPEPATLALVGAALLGAGALRRRKARAG